jgi:phosphatidate cytidylyltransferase
MFMQRLIMTLILAPAVILLILYGKSWMLIGAMVFIMCLIAAESCKLIPALSLNHQLGFLAVLLLCLGFAWFWFSLWLHVGLILWFAIAIAILSFPKSQAYWGFSWVVMALFWLVLPLWWQSFVAIYQLPQGQYLIIYLLSLIWAADIGAYLAGKCWGKHKVLPKVSPGKSWEGIIGGLFLAMLVAIVGWHYFAPAATFFWFFWMMVIVLISIEGDLFISILKRRCHLKDTGALIPGHGGLLDRLDSLIAAAPFFYFGLTKVLA